MEEAPQVEPQNGPTDEPQAVPQPSLDEFLERLEDRIHDRVAMVADAVKDFSRPMKKTEIADFFGVSVRSLDRWIQQGTFPRATHEVGGKERWVPKTVLEATRIRRQPGRPRRAS